MWREATCLPVGRTVGEALTLYFSIASWLLGSAS
jgi:hypothetical protein